MVGSIQHEASNENDTHLLDRVLCGITWIGSPALVGAHRSNQALRTANQQLERELRTAQAKADASRTENEESAKQLKLLRDALDILQSRISEMDAANTQEAAVAANPPEVKPYQAPAYVGRELLGSAWVIPRNVRMDTNTQRYVYETVIALDESLRGRFVTYFTNVIERAIPTTLVDNYYPPTVNYIAASSTEQRETFRSPPPPQAPGPPAPAPKFDPGNGTTTPQRLGTAAGDIKTRPQMPAKRNTPTR